MNFVFAVLVRGDGIDLVLQTRADKDRALAAERQRARIRHAAGVDFEIKALRRLQLVERQLVGRGGGATGASLAAAALFSGRPMSGEPGGSTARAAACP